MSETGTGLPPAVELLWGLRDKGRRGGPKPALSLEKIVAGAVALADEGGIAALSMSRLAERLGFTPMSLYRYVSSKDELLLLALDAAIGVPGPPPDSPWRDRVRAWCQELTLCYRQHPWMLDVPISGLPAGPNQLAWFDRGLAALAATTLEEAEKASSVLLLATFVRTQAQLVRDIVGAMTAGAGEQPWSAVVTRLADPERYPAVARVIAAGVFDDDASAPGQGEDAFPDDEYSFGLDRILDGLAALDRTRRPPAPLAPLAPPTRAE
jgi:AcrR family transcriptional regulator